MKNRFFAAMAIALFALCSTAFAQIVRPIRFTLPQDVTAGAVSLPAGDCSMESIHGDTSSSTLVIRCGDGITATAAAMRVSRMDGRASDRTELVLRNHEGKLELYRVWVAGEAFGYELLPQ
jgi:hypothetical protein